MHVAEIWRYPVKSMLGGRVDAATLDAGGIVGDRRWAARDAVTGGIVGGKQLGALMRCAAGDPDGPTGPAVVTLPDGTCLRTDDPQLDSRLSAAVGRAVRLSPLAPADALEQYLRPPSTSTDPLGDLRTVFGLEDGEPLPDLSGFTPEQLRYSTPPGRYHDAAPLLVLTTSALDSLRQELPDSVVDVRRFRPTLVIDTGDEPGYPELSWATGRRLRLGRAVIELTVPCLRCVMVSRELDAATPADRRILRPLVAHLGQQFGRYADVVEPGRFATGDAVSWLD